MWRDGSPSSHEHRVSTINGDLSLGSDGGYSVSVRAVSGSIQTQVPTRREDGKGQRRVVVGDGRAGVTFRTVSGDLILRDAGTRDAGMRDAGAPKTDAVVTPADRGEEMGMLALLEALERGEIDVDEASRRLGAAHG